MAFHPYSIRIARAALLLLIVGGAAACGTEPEAALGPPEGWTGTERRWWLEGADTTRLFRDLETLDAMRIDDEGAVYAGGSSPGDVAEVGRSRLARAVKESLVRLFRNEPSVVDSLFERFVTPKIAATDPFSTASGDLAGDFGAARDRYRRVAYKLISNNFQQPQTALRLGTDVPIVYPDSLRRRGVQGAVRMQVALDAEGRPLGIELLAPVHPVLDSLAMRATTQMRWRPAYLMRGGKWRPIPSWTRFSLNFSIIPEAPSGASSGLDPRSGPYALGERP